MSGINKFAVIGSGMMGKGIAQVLASLEDARVTMYDIKDSGAIPAIRKNLDQLVDKGVVLPETREAIISRIRFTMDINDPGISECQMLIEAVFEDMELKRDTFDKLEAVCSEKCIFCTNSSVMSPTEISARLKHKERFVGTHFWNPAHLIPLVEVIKSEHSSDETAQTVIDVLNACGKKAVLCKKDVPGFIANRLQHALWREAISIVENGIADAETVDIAIKNSFGLRLPQLAPLENSDMAGNDLCLQIHNYILPHLEDSHEPSPYLKRLNEEGKLGFKTGEGFMKWTEEEMERSRTELNEYLIKMVYGK